MESKRLEKRQNGEGGRDGEIITIRKEEMGKKMASGEKRRHKERKWKTEEGK